MMELRSKAEFSVLNEILSKDELTKLDDCICVKLESYFKEKCDEIFTKKAVFETRRKQLGKNFIYYLLYSTK